MVTKTRAGDLEAQTDVGLLSQRLLERLDARIMVTSLDETVTRVIRAEERRDAAAREDRSSTPRAAGSASPP